MAAGRGSSTFLSMLIMSNQQPLQGPVIDSGEAIFLIEVPEPEAKAEKPQKKAELPPLSEEKIEPVESILPDEDLDLLLELFSKKFEKIFKNDPIELPPSHAKTLFASVRRPAVSIFDYTHRAKKNGKAQMEHFISAFILIDRLSATEKVTLDSFSFHRIFITAMLIATKTDDFYFNNTWWAKIGGIPTKEMNALEKEFYKLTSMNVFITAEEYQSYETNVKDALEAFKREKTSENASNNTPVASAAAAAAAAPAFRQ